MVRAGLEPVDRAHAHARWAERYDAQGDTQRSFAHFGRAMHYAQMVQAFGAPRRARDSREADSREADSGDIVVGRWEDGAEAWYTVNKGPVKRRRLEPSWPGHDTTSSDTMPQSPQRQRRPPKLPAHQELVDMIEELYKSESRGIVDSVHRGSGGHWFIYRYSETGCVYLVPTRLATDDKSVRDLVESLIRRKRYHDNCKRALMEGLLIVQDQRPACVHVKRGGASWDPATEIETFAYYDFLLRQPLEAHVYLGVKPVSELLSIRNISEDSRRALLSVGTPIPAHLQDEESGNLDIAIKRDRSGIYVGNNGVGNNGGFGSNRRQISDVAWRLPRQAS